MSGYNEQNPSKKAKHNSVTVDDSEQTLLLLAAATSTDISLSSNASTTIETVIPNTPQLARLQTQVAQETILLENTYLVDTYATEVYGEYNYDLDACDFDIQQPPEPQNYDQLPFLMPPKRPVKAKAITVPGTKVSKRKTTPTTSTAASKTRTTTAKIKEKAVKLVAETTKNICACERESAANHYNLKPRLTCLLQHLEVFLASRQFTLSAEAKIQIARCDDFRALDLATVLFGNPHNNNRKRTTFHYEDEDEPEDRFKPKEDRHESTSNNSGSKHRIVSLTEEICQRRILLTFMQKYQKTHPQALIDGPSIQDYRLYHAFFESL